MRNAGIKNLYKRGQTYYRLKGGKWESLRTKSRVEAKKRLKDLEERDNALKWLGKKGINPLLDAITHLSETVEKISSGQDKPLAPASANSIARSNFEEEATRFYNQLACRSVKTKVGWGTYHRVLLEIVRSLDGTGTEDPDAIDPWKTIEHVGPSGLWSAYRETGAGPSSLNQFLFYLRKIISDFVAKGFLPQWFLQNLDTINTVEVHPRSLHIPSPEEMEKLLSLCCKKDSRLGHLIRAFTYSGARLSGLLGKNGLKWSDVRFDLGTITLLEKGNKPRTIPMGPQLRSVLLEIQKTTGEEARVFPFGSTLEDRCQEILRDAAGQLGGAVRDMRFFTHYVTTLGRNICAKERRIM